MGVCIRPAAVPVSNKNPHDASILLRAAEPTQARQRLRTRSSRGEASSAEGTPIGSGSSGASSPFFSAAGSLGPAGSVLSSLASSGSNRCAGRSKLLPHDEHAEAKKIVLEPAGVH
jgi:hypothetical protein